MKLNSIFQLSALLLALLLGACSSIGNRQPPLPPVHTTPGTGAGGPSSATGTSSSNAPNFKLSKATVSWIDNPGIPVLTASGSKGSINSGDTVRTLTALRSNAPRDLAAALRRARQVQQGSSESISLMPVGALLDARGETTAVIIRVVVTQRASGAQWRTDIELGDRKLPVASKPAMNTDASSNAFSNTLIAVMSRTGLL